MKTSKDHTERTNWKKADARILGQILAAQNIDFVLPDSTHVAEFFAETLIAIPGITACRVCLNEVSILRGKMDTGICDSCEVFRGKGGALERVFSFGAGFNCQLAGQSGMQFNTIASPSHHFGFFIFQVNDLDAFNIYRPFIDNLANYIALSLENRQQKDLLQKAHDELEHKVAERTEELRASNEAIKDLYNNAPCGYHSLDKDGFIILINDTELRWLGYSRDEVIGKVTFRDLLTANSLKLFEENFPAFKERGWVSDLEFEMVRKDGTILPVLLNATAIADSDGNYVMSRSTIFDITERKRNERELITLNRAINQSSDAVFLINEQLTFTYVNDAACRSLGYTREELLTMGPSDIDAFITYDQAKEIMNKLFASGSYPRFETWHKMRDGRIFPVEISSSVVEYDGAKFSLTTVHDITERKQAENALQERENHSQSLLRLSRKLEQAQTYSEVLNAAQDEVRDVVGYQNLWAYLFTPDKKQAKALFARGPISDSVMSEDGTATLTIQGDRMMEEIVETRDIVIVEDAQTDERPDKKIVEKMKNRTLVNIPILLFDRHLGSIGVGTFGDEGVLIPTASQQEYLKALASHMAVTLDRIHLLEERRQAEEKLRESEERYRAISNLTSDYAYSFRLEADGTYTREWTTDSFFKITGYSPTDPQFMNGMISIVHPDDRHILEERNRRAEAQEEVSVVAYRIIRKDGEIRWLNNFGGSTHDAAIGKAIRFYGAVSDITERKRAEENLRASEEKYRALAENIPNVVYQCKNDSRYTFVYLNDAIEELTGYSRGDFLEQGLSFFDLYHPDDLKIVPTPEENNITVINRQPFHITYRIRHKSGEWRWVDEWGTGIPGPDGNVEYLEGIMMDITERRQHEREREAIISVSAALRQARTKTGILNIILDQLVNLFNVDGAMLVLPNAQTGGFVNEMGRGIVGERMMGLAIPSGVGICSWVITNKTPYLNNHADQDPLFYRPDLLGDSHCVACAPLLAQEQAMGALWLARRMDFAEQDKHLLTAIADIAANAIHRVMLHEQTELQLHHLIALHQIDIAISSNFDSNLTLNVILNNVKNELDVDAADILLLSSVTHTLDYVAGLGFRTRGIEQSHVKLSDGFAGTAAQEYRTVSCPDLKLAHASFSRSSLLADEEFAVHFATPLIVKGQVKGVLELFHRKAFEPESDWIDYFETLATQAAIAIESASLLESLQRSNSELKLAYDATIEGWSRALDLRDRETEGHTQRVTDMALALADKMGISEVEKQHLRRGSLLHDIGKMGVPDSILLKPGPLSEAEAQIMRQHPMYAYQMLSPIAYLKPALDISYCHHEKWDGSGYPRGLKWEEIPLSARLFAIVDVFDALTSDRPYRRAWPREDVYSYIQAESGKHFDPQIVKIVLENRMW